MSKDLLRHLASYKSSDTFADALRGGSRGLGYTFNNCLTVSANVFNFLKDEGVEVLGAPPTGRPGFIQLAYTYPGLNY